MEINSKKWSLFIYFLITTSRISNPIVVSQCSNKAKRYMIITVAAGFDFDTDNGEVRFQRLTQSLLRRWWWKSGARDLFPSCLSFAFTFLSLPRKSRQKELSLLQSEATLHKYQQRQRQRVSLTFHTHQQQG